MTRRTIRGWVVLHSWSSLVCTAFLLMLCITGLPLIFHHEIDELLDDQPPIAAMPAGTPLQSLDTILARALADRPGEVGLYMSFDEDRPVVNVTTGPSPDAGGAEMTLTAYDQRDGSLVGAIAQDGVMDFILQLHTDMFAGLPGMLFLGAMGVLFLAAIVSGVVLYAPFMRKLDFGTVRTGRARRTKWLDYHNLLGVVVLAWASVVGLTGVINTLAEPIIAQWRSDDLAAITREHDARGLPVPTRLASINAAVETAKAAVPGSRVQFVAFPGVAYSSRQHYAVFLQGDTPLTKGLLTPALVDARTGALAAVRPMPWYVQALQLSQPLHFGDYGALPLKILWAVLDLFTILVLGSGLYLWFAKRHASSEAKAREVESGGVLVPAE
ncbi:PepSY-associated TM helix domain-containing protein [Sphingomonas qomolangmaensis]|uniref:PepSY domain-containing protein n=1 Tax=Sphingomonas qomolangmaensis TaxID=2918765 RepID=A0ABY5LAL2_9SPHN|nr:PepSY-associated TM helix domain-containing protein [Sphingomonas qomolangmaensis]UUL82834.1 PepSY domain-containing protein [Sphingomonas qomolangmaensis]